MAVAAHLPDRRLLVVTAMPVAAFLVLLAALAAASPDCWRPAVC
ncbi:hypothetical protein [Thermocatellispora tengchongensis]